MSGQRLAHFFRNSVQSRNWMTAARRMGPLSKVGQSCLCMPGLVEVREPQEPRKVVEMVLREARALCSLYRVYLELGFDADQPHFTLPLDEDGLQNRISACANLPRALGRDG